MVPVIQFYQTSERGKGMDHRLETFIEQYIETLFWSETDGDDTPLDLNHEKMDLSSETLEKIRKDCEKFFNENMDLLEKVPGGYSQCGHDFALTRNGHGAGFWDRGLGKMGDILTEKCDEFGQFDLYIGDDGKIYS